MPQLHQVEALTFDVFGTVVDWRTSVTSEVAAVASARKVQGNWHSFADEWRRGYRDGMDLVNKGKKPWRTVDVIHREKLDELLPKYGLGNLNEDQRRQLNLVWHRLEPWADAVEGLNRLRRRFVVATLSNGNMRLLTDMAKHAGLPWDCILSSELAGAFKPDPRAYRKAAELLAVPTERVMMTAAHSSDLRAAASTGMRTAFVARPLEYGPNGETEVVPGGTFDVVATDFLDLARKLDC